MKRIGVLALQGAFIEHIHALNKLGAETFEIRQRSDLAKGPIDGLVIPGGESTVIGKLLRELDLLDDIKKLIQNGLPVFGTCAGLILLAKSISNDDKSYLGTMNIVAKRNAYGRQLGSFRTTADFKGIGKIDMTFIRAPFIESAGEGVDVLAVVDGKIVAARQDNMLAIAFHPELTSDLSVHKYFLEKMVK
jgi:pyridoxal 5'-phosphate synthase pdxT subunit